MPIAPEMARLNITYGGHNGDLPDPVSFDATDADVKTWITEAVRGGGVPGIPATPNADFKDFVVDRFAATGDLPNRISVRPKTPFGSRLVGDEPDDRLVGGNEPEDRRFFASWRLSIDRIDPSLRQAIAVAFICVVAILVIFALAR